jgi:hypothetical protein
VPVGSASKANATLAKVFDLVPLDRGSGPSDFAILQQERDLMLGENAVAGALTKAQPGAAVDALFAGLPTGPAAEVEIQTMGFVPPPPAACANRTEDHAWHRRSLRRPPAMAARWMF